MTPKTPIFLDSHSTTPLDPRVLDAMMPYLRDEFGNASSLHLLGLEAAGAVERSRELVANALGAEPREIVFTSGATESNNLAIKGVAESLARKGRHIVTCVTEHSAVLDPCAYLEKRGYEITRLGVDAEGKLDLPAVESALRDDTILVSIMHANNEIGVLHDIAAIGALCAERGVLFHTDATQSVGKIPVHVRDMNIHLLSLSAHKFYGPKGVGVLYVRRRDPRVRLAPTQHGGGHERGLRSGTLNVPGIVGLASALELCVESMEEESARLRVLRDRLRDKLTSELDHIIENGAREPKLPHSLNLAFQYVSSEALLQEIEEIAVSSGSACSSIDPGPSHVILAIAGEDRAASSVRFGLTRFTTEEEVDYTANRIIETVRKLRKRSSMYQDISRRS